MPADPRAPARRLPGPTALAGALAVAIALLVGSTLGSVQYRPQADEGHYLRYAEVLAGDGFGGLAAATRAYLADPSAGVFPAPTRVGFLVPAALALRCLGGGFAALSRLSLAAQVALLLVTFGFVRRSLGDWAALGVTALVGTSPLLLGLARRALADAVLALLLTLALWAWLEILRPAARTAWTFLFVAAFAATILAKESSVLFLVPFGLIALVRDLRADRPLPRWRLAAAAGLPLAIAASCWIALAGSLSGVVRLATATLAAPAHNPYAVDFGSGPWSRYLVDFLLLSPWTVLLAIAGLGVLAVRRGPSTPARALALDLALFAAGALAVFAPLTKNVRYLAVLELPIAVLAVVFLVQCAASRGRWGRRLCAAIVLLLAAGRIRTFDHLFVRAGIYDPVTFNLLREQGMVPRR